MALFCSLFSGSSGNCTLIGNGRSAVLIDAGSSAKSIFASAEKAGCGPADIKAVFVTHEHSDHIKGIPVLSRRYKIPVYANRGTIEGMANAPSFKNFDSSYINELSTGETAELDGMTISSFKTPHDSIESVGYRIGFEDGTRIAVVTDLGSVTENVLENITGCKIVMIESNHDVNMLMSGRYPYFLKKRILSGIGHLSNEDCSAVLPQLVQNGARYIFLAHLSTDNNLPELAVQSAVASLNSSGLKNGEDYEIEASPRFCHSRVCCI